MNKTLDKVVKRARMAAVVTAGLVGAVLSSGCDIESMYGMGIAGNAYKTHDPYAANVIGNAMMREGEAKEGRSETTVVVQQPENNDQKSEQSYEERDKEDKINRRALYAESLAERMRQSDVTSEAYEKYKRNLKSKAPDIYAEYVKKGLIKE
jgi:hypothetical protein